MSTHEETRNNVTQKRTRGPAGDTMERALEGALACLRTSGRAGTTLSAVSRASGLSRPTLYAHFDNLDALVAAAVERAALDLSRRIGRETSRAATPGAALVEFVVVAHREFRADPVVRLIVEMTLDPNVSGHGELSESTFALTGASLARLLGEGHPALARLEELSETFNRFLMSVLTYSSPRTATDDALRDYLTRTLIPALGLD